MTLKWNGGGIAGQFCCFSERREGSAVHGGRLQWRAGADFLGLVGVLVDPTTAGLGDSERAMGYAEPWDDRIDN